MNRYLAGLTPTQVAIVAGVFWFTLIGAVVLAFGMRWWNAR